MSLNQAGLIQKLRHPISRAVIVCVIALIAYFICKKQDPFPFLKTFFNVVFPGLPSALALVFIWQIQRDPRYSPRLRRAWLFVGIGIFFAIVADALLTLLGNPPISIADLLFL